MLENILCGIIIALVSGIVGKYLGERNKVTTITCSEHQRACQQLIIEKLNHLTKEVASLTNVVNNKLLGI